MDFTAELTAKKNLVDAELKKYLSIKYPNKIYEAMSYSVSAGGKRLRPILLLSSCEAFCGSTANGLPFACALEMIHTYSLIHDDLPAMDNDALRRGVPTNHVVYGEAIAILAGDGLLNMAYEIMSAACLTNLSQNSLMAMIEIATSAGTLGMIGGQTVDILSENGQCPGDKKSENDTLLYIHRNKTAALIRAALVSGAILGGADKGSLDLIGTAGLKMGQAFQIKDDLLDVLGDEARLGKPTNSDAKNSKMTYVSMFGLEKASQDYLALSTEAVDLFEKVGCEFLAEYARSVIDREL